MAADVRSARESVHVLFYIMGLDEATEDFFEALAERAEAGVPVRVLCDHWGAFSHGSQYRAMRRKLDAHGIEHFPDEPDPAVPRRRLPAARPPQPPQDGDHRRRDRLDGQPEHDRRPLRQALQHPPWAPLAGDDGAVPRPDRLGAEPAVRHRLVLRVRADAAAGDGGATLTGHLGQLRVPVGAQRPGLRRGEQPGAVQPAVLLRHAAHRRRLAVLRARRVDARGPLSPPRGAGSRSSSSSPRSATSSSSSTPSAPTTRRCWRQG